MTGNFGQTQLTIEFTASDVNSQTMGLKIVTSNDTITWDKLPVGQTTWRSNIPLPSKVSLTFSGKGPMDTVVDEYQNILQDKSVTINNIYLDGVPVWPYWCDHKIVLLTTDGRSITGRSVCFNGTVILDFSEPTAFFWLAKSKLA